MTRTRHLHRSAALATATALFVLTGTTVAAFAGQADSVVASTGRPATASAVVSPAASIVAAEVAAARSAAAHEAAVRAAAAKAAAAKAAAAEKAAAKKAAARLAAAKKAAAQKAAATKQAAAATKATAKTIYIKGYVNAPGSQSAIDKCQLVLWSSSPLWLAAHNYCGYQWLAFVKTGTTVVVTSGAAQGTYRVYGHLRLGRQSGAMPSTGADLVLQTCVGSGTGLSLLRRV